MALYLISYDINSSDEFEYDALWEKLEELGATKILYSEWVLIEEVGQASSIYDEIAPLTQQKDRLLVQEILKDAVWDQLLISEDEFEEFLSHARG